MDLYRLAIVEIKTTDQFKSFTDNKEVNFQVMPEIIPLNQMGFIFREELQKQTGIDFGLSNDTIRISKNLDLIKLSDNKKSDLRIFFSDVVNDPMITSISETVLKSQSIIAGQVNLRKTTRHHLPFTMSF